MKALTRRLRDGLTELLRSQELIEPESTNCYCCGLPLHRIGEDVSDALDTVPALLRVIRTIRPK